ncbi:hypothetical protein POM88_049567 [Heracleum sosnowskyi]|uniref:Uncharacterized protein n=1 Tax=Heracleum sosnowskyi TaxID=360622 RepID=A0AAD8M0N6_9APIA|nr:hypothetical protein POM88_049567 [Heracleum sosnowskyi]
MIIVTWNGSGSPSLIFNANVFKKVPSVYITAAILKLGQAMLDVVLNLGSKAKKTKRRKFEEELLEEWVYYITSSGARWAKQRTENPCVSGSNPARDKTFLVI